MRESIENTPEKVEKEEESKKIESIAYFFIYNFVNKMRVNEQVNIKVGCKL